MTPRDEFIELNGLSFHYREFGGRGQPLVLLHGLASNARIWDMTAPLLAERFRVLALDQRGHGLSGKPDDGYDFQSVAGDLHAFREAIGLERPALAGLKLQAFLQGARNWPGLGEFWHDEVQEMVLANFRIDDDETIQPHLTRENHLKILRSLWEQKPSELWSALLCPLLLVPAAREHSDPRNAIWMEHKRKGLALAQERAPAAQVVWMEDTIHDVPLQRPEELARVIADFLQGLA